MPPARIEMQVEDQNGRCPNEENCTLRAYVKDHVEPSGTLPLPYGVKGILFVFRKALGALMLAPPGNIPQNAYGIEGISQQGACKSSLGGEPCKKRVGVVFVGHPPISAPPEDLGLN